MIPTVILPKPESNTPYSAWDRGGFRGMAHAWHGAGLVNIRRSSSPHCWMNEVGDVLLYDRPTLEFLNPDMPYQLGLFGNPEPPANGRANSYWTFWPTVHGNVEALRSKLPDYRNRSSRLVWLGSYENKVQRGYRPVNWWRTAVDLFSYGHRKEYDNRQYLRLIKQARFGLCLRGYGPKCSREIEYMAMGVVPVFTYGCSLSYYNRLVEGQHYVYASTPEEAMDITSNMPEDVWQAMSDSCVAWYESNCSTLGSFLTTRSIICKEHP